MEQQPLLSASDGDYTSAQKPQPPPRLSAAWVVTVLAIIVACLSLASDLIGVPIIRIVEDAVCQDYYASQGAAPPSLGRIDEKLCKLDEIQIELAYVLGVQEMLDAFSSFIFALPYGFLADSISKVKILTEHRIGRTKIFTLSLVGIVLGGLWAVFVLRNRQIFGVRAIWLSSAFQLIGGGNGIPMTMIYAMIADVQSPDARTNSFFYMNVCGLVTAIIAPSVSARLMDISPWYPVTIGLCVAVLSTCLSLVIPETLHSQTVPVTPTAPGYTDSPHGGGLKAHAKTMLIQIRDSGNIIFRSRPLRLLLATFFIEQLTMKTTRFGIRYTSKRFGWSIAQFGYFLSVRAAVSILVLLVALPTISKILHSPRFSFQYSATRNDLVLARFSSILLVLGSLLSAGPTIFVVISGFVVSTFGIGFSALCRSIATSLVTQEHTATLYTIFNVVDAVGAFIAGPLMAWAFVVGMRLGGLWLGLPYTVLAILGAVAAAAVWFVRLPAHLEDTDEA